MKIDNIKDLTKIIQLCRKQGVQSIKIDNIELILGHMPVQQAAPDYSTDFPEAAIKVPQYTGEITPPEPIKTEELSHEQLLFYSADSREQVETQ